MDSQISGNPSEHAIMQNEDKGALRVKTGVLLHVLQELHSEGFEKCHTLHKAECGWFLKYGLWKARKSMNANFFFFFLNPGERQTHRENFECSKLESCIPVHVAFQASS